MKFRWVRDANTKIAAITNDGYFLLVVVYTSRLVLVSGKMTEGVKCFASSKSIEAYDIIITMSPTTTLRAAGPLRQIQPEPRSPLIT